MNDFVEYERKEYDLVSYKTVMDITYDQILSVIETDIEFYGKYTFVLANEQYFVDDDEREPNKIFIVVKFLPADINFGQDILPIAIKAVSESNGLEVVQRFFLEYTQMFNLIQLKMETGEIIYQNYTSPSINSYFENVFDGYCAVLSLSGSFLISKNINRCTVKYFVGETLKKSPVVITQKDSDLLLVGNQCYRWSDEENSYVKYDGEELDILNFSDTYNATPDTQPYYNNNNFTDSLIKYGTYSFTIVSYLTKSALNNKALKIKARILDCNTNFYFRIEYDESGLNVPLLKYKMISANSTQNVGEMPSIAMAFTN